MSLYMLDTDTVSYLIGGTSPVLDARVAAAQPDALCISAITRGELLYGLKLMSGAHRLARLVDQFLVRVQCRTWDEACATHFASIAADLRKAGTQIGSMDAMIAGHAMALDAVMVTNNARHFSRVAALKIENWSRED